MDLQQTSQLLVVASSVDNRQVTEMAVRGWWEALGSYGYEECREALARHRRDSSDYVAPHHLATGVRKIRAERAAAETKSIEDRLASRARYDRPSPEVEARMIAAWNDPEAFDAAVADYDAELRAKGVEVQSGTRHSDSYSRTFAATQGQGKDYAIPVGDRD